MEVDGKDTIGDVAEKAAEALEVDACDMTLHHDGVALDELSENVTQTTLGEGSEVEARPSEKVVAKRGLGTWGWRGAGGCGSPVLAYGSNQWLVLLALNNEPSSHGTRDALNAISFTSSSGTQP